MVFQDNVPALETLVIPRVILRIVQHAINDSRRRYSGELMHDRNFEQTVFYIGSGGNDEVVAEL